MTLNWAWLLVSGRLVFQKLLISWDFLAQPSVGFRENSLRKTKRVVRDSSLGENALLKVKVRGEWPGCFEHTGRQQYLKWLITIKVFSRAPGNLSNLEEDELQRRPHLVSVLSAKNRKAIICTGSQKNWSNWLFEHENEFTAHKWPPQSSNLNPTAHLCYVMEWEICTWRKTKICSNCVMLSCQYGTTFLSSTLLINAVLKELY